MLEGISVAEQRLNGFALTALALLALLATLLLGRPARRFLAKTLIS